MGGQIADQLFALFKCMFVKGMALFRPEIELSLILPISYSSPPLIRKLLFKTIIDKAEAKIAPLRNFDQPIEH